VYLFIQDGVCLFEVLCLYLLRALYILHVANCTYRCSRYTHVCSNVLLTDALVRHFTLNVYFTVCKTFVYLH